MIRHSEKNDNKKYHLDTSDIKVSVYSDTKDTIGRTVTLSAVIKRIGDGGRGLTEKTQHCNKLAITDPKAYRKYKEKYLPAVTISGTFFTRAKEYPLTKAQKAREEKPMPIPFEKRMKCHSGLAVLDFDDIPSNLLPSVLAVLSQMPHVLLCFVSPSGLGIKVIVRIDPVPAVDEVEHKGAHEACVEFFSDLATEFEFKLDTSGSDPTRLCFLAHDPLLIVNENAIPIEWDRDAYIAKLQEEQEQARESEYTTAFHGDIDTTALDYLDPDADYDEWLDVGIALYNSGGTWQMWDKWSSRGAKYEPGECERRWQTFGNYTGRKITWGTIVHRTKQNGYKPKRPSRTDKINAIRDGTLSPLGICRKRVKLVKGFANSLLDKLAKTQELIRKILRLPARVIGFRADTGVGKNRAAEDYALEGSSLLINVPTGDLAIDLETRMRDRVSNANLPTDYVFRRRGLMHRWNDGVDTHLRFPHEIPCIQAARCDAFRRKGGNMYESICPDCRVKHICIVRGFRSQPERAKEALMVIMSHPDFHINPALRGFAKQYLSDGYGQKRMVVQDDISLEKLYLECEVTRERLKEMRDDWEGAFLGRFAKEMLHILESEGNPWAIGEYLNTLTTKQKGLLNFQLTTSPN